ncbi:MAG TPA: SHOCT domain-containing protein [Candidatus Kryptonia bacterium]|nr:SHOCT domain-containing protein [Candidatus Kryptonia bacterium]
MRLRDIVTSGVWLVVFAVHFGLQWYGWKAHIEEIRLANGEWLWSHCSLPLFVVISRRIQNLHFFEILVANSALWATAAAWAAHLTQRLMHRPKRRRAGSIGAKPKVAAADITPADRLVELKRMLDQGRISREEYQEKREAILVRF